MEINTRPFNEQDYWYDEQCKERREKLKQH